MLEDRGYMRERPYQPQRSATVLLLMINAAIFVVQSLSEHYTTFPLREYFYLRLEGLKHGFIWQIITFQFLHGGIFHIICNSLAIWFFGRELEESLGRANFWKLYFSCGIAGGILQMILAWALPGPFGGAVIGADRKSVV